MHTARDKSQQLQQRVDALRRKMAGLGGKELSRREENWASEVLALDASLDDAASTGNNGIENGENIAGSLQSRFDAVAGLQKDLVERAKSVTTNGGQEEEAGVEEKSLRESSRGVSSDFRKQKLAQVMQLLERETALVDAVTERLGKLGGLAR